MRPVDRRIFAGERESENFSSPRRICCYAIALFEALLVTPSGVTEPSHKREPNLAARPPARLPARVARPALASKPWTRSSCLPFQGRRLNFWKLNVSEQIVCW